ncbi:AraC family transcriptional regulator [Chryseobacterium ginsengisoli]|uniref:AraC family transcriptional regulator n=1 Tax=Chryseobacterium ginsengisoli TaxID=363853 RepID=A0ABP9MFP7_9FLAO
MIKKLFFIFLIGVFQLLLSQETYSDFYKLREKYENFAENDSKAFPFIQPYINKAKREKNYDKLVQGYKDGVFYSSLNEEKLKYADSMVWAANQSSNEDLKIIAHVDKGVIYYYHYKKFQLALNEYLEAYKYSKNTKNEYLKYQNLYHIGVVKSYLGYHEDASELFTKCLVYYREKARSITKLHPNEIYNNTKGYLNSLHQLIICYRNLGKNKEADAAIQTGLAEIGNNPEYDLEKGYFLVSKGISEYKRNQFQAALKNFNESLPAIKDSRDFARLSVDYFYIGKSYSGLKKTKESIIYFKKIDSIFQKHQFILPELRENYEILIDYSKKEKNQTQQLYYTSQLLKADSIMSKDFIYLSPKIHKDYDTKTLLEEKDKLQSINYLGTIIIIVLVIWAIGLVTLLTRRHKKAKEIQQKYILVEEKFAAHQNIVEEDVIPVIEEKKINLTEGKVGELLRKLKTFEDKKEFTQKGLTIGKLATQLGTNSNYLSQVINEYKKANFNKYLSELRINYITNLLFEDKKYLKYNIETLAKECGIASRQNFSDLFYEINGIRPTDFIKKRKQEIENNGTV